MNQQNMYAPPVTGQPMPGTPIGNPNIPYMGQPVNTQGNVGYRYNPVPTSKVTQPVDREKSKYLKQTEDQLDMRITKPESIRNSCTHKDPDTGAMALIDLGGNLVECRVCGERFHLIEPKDMTEEVIKAKVEEVIDILQSAKTMYLNAPEEFVVEFYQVISLLRKLPKIFAKSASDYAKYDVYALSGVSPAYGQTWAPSGDPFAVYNSLLMSTPGGYQQPPYMGSAAYPPYGYQQPNYAYPQQQPYAPAYQQPYGYQATPPAPQPAPPVAPVQQPVGPDGYMKPQWMNNYIDPISGANITPPTAAPNPVAPQQPYNNYVAPVNPNDNPLGYGAPQVTNPPPAPITPPATNISGTEEVSQTKRMTV